MGENESNYGLQAAPPPPPPPAAPNPLVARPPEDPMGLADVVASALPGWYALLECHLAQRAAVMFVTTLCTLLCLQIQ